ncbi:MAG TPA: decaprenyl-phosphate phosphoribosyltransferase [Microthrixaceae bacterium]|nr:decaprenyl-phosphate phosphoribosyltransferase [Microthrixaceae bacterium]HMT23788.1 decaprenyl-phosphate phosphoribosyltransferase [Microthrixaceae bacterium]HMT60876.1 decaprenyl-phosphate phosphoribosyltransferase [Microthrixaceae bacterium]
MSLAAGMVKACRPKQWAKNVLVVVAPAAAMVYIDRTPDGIEFRWWAVARTLVAFAAFSMVASATYLVNDSVDAESDRRHPTKRNRPIAAGVVSIPLAAAMAIVLALGGFGLALSRNWQFCVVVAIYAVQTTLYSFWLKNEPVLDLVALSSGFILRLVGGAYALQVEVSPWFFIISCFGSLFIAVGKRLAEKRELGENHGSIRKTLAIYTEPYLRLLQGIAATIVIMAYVMWAFEKARLDPSSAVWMEVSILPFLVAILRYGLLVELGKGSAPEDVLAADRQMQLMGALWVVLVGVGFYVG